MSLKVGRELHDTEHQFVEFLGEAVGRDVFEYDAGEVGKTVDEVGMMVGKMCRGRHSLLAAAFGGRAGTDGLLKHRKDVLFLKSEMVLHLAFIVGKELSEYSTIAVSGMGGDIEQVALDVRKAFVEIVAMR